MDKTQKSDELSKHAKKHAGVDTLLELQSMYEKPARQKNTVFRSNDKRTTMTTNSTEGQTSSRGETLNGVTESTKRTGR